MADLLTADEHEAMRLSGELANVCRRIIGNGPAAHGDWAEFAGAIHDIQSRIMGQAAARAYPDRYRPLGGWPEHVGSEGGQADGGDHA